MSDVSEPTTEELAQGLEALSPSSSEDWPPSLQIERRTLLTAALRLRQLEAENTRLTDAYQRTCVGIGYRSPESQGDPTPPEWAHSLRHRAEQLEAEHAELRALIHGRGRGYPKGGRSEIDYFNELEAFRSQLAEAERDRERFHQQIEAAVSYAGILAIEVRDLIGLAIAHGFKGWPEHQVIGDELRAILQLEQGEIEAAGREAIDEARASEAEEES